MSGALTDYLPLVFDAHGYMAYTNLLSGTTSKTCSLTLDRVIMFSVMHTASENYQRRSNPQKHQLPRPISDENTHTLCTRSAVNYNNSVQATPKNKIK